MQAWLNFVDKDNSSPHEEIFSCNKFDLYVFANDTETAQIFEYVLITGLNKLINILTISILPCCMLNCPLKCAPARTAVAHFSEYLNHQ